MRPIQIKRLRENLGINQTDFGGMFDVSWQTISRWENGRTKPKESHIKKMESLMHVKKIEYDQVKNLATLIEYIRTYEEKIFVRVNREDRWLTLSLAELNNKEYSEKVAGFLEKGIIPVKVNQ
jgi:predicted transcriptional regulator